MVSYDFLASFGCVCFVLSFIWKIFLKFPISYGCESVFKNERLSQLEILCATWWAEPHGDDEAFSWRSFFQSSVQEVFALSSSSFSRKWSVGFLPVRFMPSMAFWTLLRLPHFSKHVFMKEKKLIHLLDWCLLILFLMVAIPSFPASEGVGLSIDPESPFMMLRKLPTSLLKSQGVRLEYVLCSS